MSKWKTIDSAPRDGTPILLFTTNYGVVEAWFFQGEWSEDTHISPAEYTGSSWVCADDQFHIEVEESPFGFHDGTATHWMPLPAPPEKHQGEKP
jgi:hypothetical protein